MRSALWLLLCSVITLTACGVPPSISPALNSFTSVTPSATGTPNSVAVLGDFEFVSVQQTGQIFTYNFSSGSQVLVTTYTTPCSSPSGMAIVPEGSSNIMAVACYDTDSLLTLNVAANGSLNLLGSVALPQVPYPNIAADGTNVFIPTFPPSGVNITPVNGDVVKVDVSKPAAPVVAAVTSLASPSVPSPNQTPTADGTALTVSGGYIYVASGSESGPLNLTSSVQVVNESTMQLVGSPFIVPHSPQQIAVSEGVAYITLYDATAVESINIANPASLQMLEVFSPPAPASCHGLGVALRGSTAYVGCYQEGNIDRINVSTPASMAVTNAISGLGSPQSLVFSGDYLFVVSSAAGGKVFMIYVGPTN